MTAQSSTTTSQAAKPESTDRAERINLSFRYGLIGIKSVAAAARYADDRKKPVAGDGRIDLRFVESAV